MKHDPHISLPPCLLEFCAVAEGIRHNDIFIEVIRVGVAIALDFIDNMMNWKN